MDLNGQFWRSEGQAEIEKSRELLQASRQNITGSLRDKKIKEAWKISLASVHPGTGDIIPIIFRPPAFLPFTAPLVVGTFLSHKGPRPTFIWQLLFHSYISGFNFANGNSTRKETENITTEANGFQFKQLLLTVGAVSYSACVGTLPQYLLTRYKLQGPSAQLIFTKIVPAPLTALLCAFNVMVIRSSEFENGIEVMDSNGKVIGFSQKAGEKAVKETALSRAAMFGTALVIPDIALHFLKRTSVLLRNPLALTSLRSILMVSLVGVMIPVSFSWNPQMGKIHRSELEPDLISTTEETDFFYNRGV
ncbi:sideroflexin-4 isoform X2 [Tiliqua scincoides]|uniref:sideroflexin-4 isoform X2 n=1 Tax=Tiliqua scincoides TaxID=71010 RepID=UPI0034623055